MRSARLTEKSNRKKLLKKNMGNFHPTPIKFTFIKFLRARLMYRLEALPRSLS